MSGGMQNHLGLPWPHSGCKSPAKLAGVCWSLRGGETRTVYVAGRKGLHWFAWVSSGLAVTEDHINEVLQFIFIYIYFYFLIQGLGRTG